MLQHLCHAILALGPVRAVLTRISLGPRPSLHRLRCVRPRRRLRSRVVRSVRQLRSYYDGVRILASVHRRLRLLALRERTRCVDDVRCVIP